MKKLLLVSVLCLLGNLAFAQSASDTTHSEKGGAIGKAHPLVIIDNVVYDSRAFSADSLTLDSRSPLAKVKAEDIESVNVLSRNEARIAYGTKGADGAIIVMTKSGSGKAPGMKKK